MKGEDTHRRTLRQKNLYFPWLMFQELKLNPVLLKAADFNEGSLLPVLSSFTGLDVATISLLSKTELVENSFKVQAAPLLCHCQVLGGTSGWLPTLPALTRALRTSCGC